MLSPVNAPKVFQKRRVEGAETGTTRHLKTDQPATIALRFLRQPSRPKAPRPVAKSGSGSGGRSTFYHPLIQVHFGSKADMCGAKSSLPPEADVRRHDGMSLASAIALSKAASIA